MSSSVLVLKPCYGSRSNLELVFSYCIYTHYSSLFSISHPANMAHREGNFLHDDPWKVSSLIRACLELALALLLLLNAVICFFTAKFVEFFNLPHPYTTVRLQSEYISRELAKADLFETGVIKKEVHQDRSLFVDSSSHSVEKTLSIIEYSNLKPSNGDDFTEMVDNIHGISEFKSTDEAMFTGLTQKLQNDMDDLGELKGQSQGNVTDESMKNDNADELRQALQAEREALNAIYSELEEERNASAIAANEAMAMIARLQEEKAAVQMEAKQFKRMVEEKTVYDQEAIALLKEILLKREEEKFALEKEIDLYRERFLSVRAGKGSQWNQASFESNENWMLEDSRKQILMLENNAELLKRYEGRKSGVAVSCAQGFMRTSGPQRGSNLLNKFDSVDIQYPDKIGSFKKQSSGANSTNGKHFSEERVTGMGLVDGQLAEPINGSDSSDYKLHKKSFNRRYGQDTSTGFSNNDDLDDENNYLDKGISGYGFQIDYEDNELWSRSPVFLETPRSCLNHHEGGQACAFESSSHILHGADSGIQMGDDFIVNGLERDRKPNKGMQGMETGKPESFRWSHSDIHSDYDPMVEEDLRSTSMVLRDNFRMTVEEDVKELTLRLNALESDRKLMKQLIDSLSTEKSVLKDLSKQLQELRGIDSLKSCIASGESSPLQLQEQESPEDKKSGAITSSHKDDDSTTKKRRRQSESWMSCGTASPVRHIMNLPG